MRAPSEHPHGTPDELTAEPKPSPHDLLNDATMWLQYARGVTTVLADLIHEAEEVDCQQLSLSLEAIAAMTRLGVQQLGEARAMAQEIGKG
jgi:hypothetical protein